MRFSVTRLHPFNSFKTSHQGHYVIPSPGWGQGRPAVGVGAVRANIPLCVVAFPSLSAGLDKVLQHRAKNPTREGGVMSRISQHNPHKPTAGEDFFVALNEARNHFFPPSGTSVINFSPACFCTTRRLRLPEIFPVHRNSVPYVSPVCFVCKLSCTNQKTGFCTYGFLYLFIPPPPLIGDVIWQPKQTGASDRLFNHVFNENSEVLPLQMH